MASPDPAVVERQQYLDILGMSDDPSLSLHELRGMTGGGVRVETAAKVQSAAFKDSLNKYYGVTSNTADNTPFDSALARVFNSVASAARTALNAIFAVKNSTARSVAEFNVLPGNTGAVNATNLATMVAAGITKIHFPNGIYDILLTEGQTLMNFVNKKGIVITGDGAVINDLTVYSNNGAFTTMFMLDNCKDSSITGITYQGILLTDPATLLGYQGAIVTRAINGTDGVVLDLRINNARYGLQTGDYATVSLGQCRNFKVRIRGTMVGYSIAAYYADNIEHDLDVDGVHRIAYLAGVNGAYGTARYSNQYIAQVAYLVSDCLISGTDAAAQADPVGAATKSRGSSNIRATVTEKGSTAGLADTYAAGISLSRVDPCVYRNIDIKVFVTSTDTVSTTIHGFIINSTANNIWSRYTYNWENTILLENIKIGGCIDKSALTVAPSLGGSNGPITLRTDDPNAITHFATIRNMVIEDFIIKQGSITYTARLFVRGLASPMRVTRLNGINAGGVAALYVIAAGSTSQPIVFQESIFSTLDMSSVPTQLVTVGEHCAITITDTDRTVYTRGGTIRGVGPRIVTKFITTAALTGASVTLAGAIPAGAKVDSIQGRIVTAITGSTGFQVGVTGDLTRYADKNVVVANSLMQPVDHAASAVTSPFYAAATDLIITSKTSAFTGGVIRLAVNYWEYPGIAS